MSKKHKETKKQKKISEPKVLDYDLGSGHSIEIPKSWKPLSNRVKANKSASEQVLKKKQDDLVDDGSDDSNPSGGVQKEVPQVSKKALKNLKAWAKKN